MPGPGAEGGSGPPGADHTDRDLDDRRCPVCGDLMLPVGLPSGEIASRCPSCDLFAI